ncbi:MAG: dicarboxylate/amino acid:cation symporter [Crocinitomicaceae bacterium]|nr:dicarboxylate/amino acid:cation symporter [Crocinitomicaceae bacterium]
MAKSNRKKLALHWKIIIGMVLGIVWAIVSAAAGWSSFTADWIAPWGDIFINILKLIALPLVFFSIVVGVSSLSDITKLGRIGGKTLGAYLITTVFAVSIGLLLVNLIKPGELADEKQREINRISYELWVNSNPDQSFQEGDVMRMAEDPAYQHLIVAAEDQNKKNAEQTQAKLDSKNIDPKSQSKAGPLQAVVDLVPSNLLGAFTKAAMLQIIFVAIFFGICLSLIKPVKAAPISAIMDGFNDVFIMMVNVVMKAAPFFVFALLAGKISSMAGDDPAAVINIFKTLAWYSLTVVIGLAIMIFGVYPTIAILLNKEMTYRKFFEGIRNAQVTAFSTSSSAATLPVTLDCVNTKLGVSKSVSDFVLPIGATVNMDGTSLYQAVAVIFLAQYHMVDLDIATQLSIVITATLASIGSAAVPSAGLIMLIMILSSVGLNEAWIAIIFGVDRILDMCRTVVNVTGDATVCTVVAASEGELDSITGHD